MTLAVVWFCTRDGGGVSRQVRSVEADWSPGVNPNSVTRLTRGIQELRKGKVALRNRGKYTMNHKTVSL